MELKLVVGFNTAKVKSIQHIIIASNSHIPSNFNLSIFQKVVYVCTAKYSDFSIYAVCIHLWICVQPPVINTMAIADILFINNFMNIVRTWMTWSTPTTICSHLYNKAACLHCNHVNTGHSLSHYHKLFVNTSISD